jgi:hypothetical protein
MKSVKEMNKKEKEALQDVVYDLLKTWVYSVGSEIDFDYPNPNRDFWLQFTTIEWNKYEKRWELNTIILHRGSELIYDSDLEYSADENMAIQLESWKNNWDAYTWFGDDVRDLKEGEILLGDLYEDFEPDDFTGHVWMR